MFTLRLDKLKSTVHVVNSQRVAIHLPQKNDFHTMKYEGCTSVLYCFGSNKLYTSGVYVCVEKTFNSVLFRITQTGAHSAS